MPKVSIDNAGRIGLVKDVSLDSLPVEAWSDLINVRCTEQTLQTFGSDTVVYDNGTESPRYFYHVLEPSGPYWLVATNGDIFKVTNTTHTEVSKLATTYGGIDDSVWCGFEFHGHQIMNVNSGVDFPQTLLPGAANFVDLTNWPASTYCKWMNAYKNFLIAYNITEGASNYKARIKWSDLADPGALPGSWDETDLTTLAGESDEAEKGGQILTARTLKDVNFIYLDASVWYMWPRNDLRIFNIKEFNNEMGIIGSHALDELFGAHYFVTQEDVVRNNGRNLESIIDKRNRQWLFNNLKEDYVRRTRVVSNHLNKEIWVCFADQNSTGWLNQALVYNVVEQTWGKRDLANFSYIARGVVDTSNVSQIIDDDTGIIDNDSSIIDASGYNAASRDMLAGDPINSGYLLLDDVASGFATIGSFERVGLTITGRDRFGEWKYSANEQKQITRVYPKFQGSGSFDIWIGTSKTPSGAVTWYGPETYTVGSIPHVDFWGVTGEAIAIKVMAKGTNPWVYSGCDMDLSVTAENVF